MSVYDEIPAWSVSSEVKVFPTEVKVVPREVKVVPREVMVIPGDANSLTSYENDSDYNEPKDKVSFEGSNTVYKDPVEAAETGEV